MVGEGQAVSADPAVLQCRDYHRDLGHEPVLVVDVEEIFAPQITEIDARDDVRYIRIEGVGLFDVCYAQRARDVLRAAPTSRRRRGRITAARGDCGREHHDEHANDALHVDDSKWTAIN